MNCQEVKARLSAWIDNALDEKEVEKVQSHIDQCSECRKELEELKELKTILSAIDDAPIPDEFDERLHLALKAEAEKMRQEKIIPINTKKSTNWRRISSIAAVFMVGLFSVILYNNNLDEFNQQDMKNVLTNTPSAVSDEVSMFAEDVTEQSPQIASQDTANDTANSEEGMNQAKVKAVSEPESGGLGEVSNQAAPENLQSYAMPALIDEIEKQTTESAIENPEPSVNLRSATFNLTDIPEEMKPYMEQLEQILIDKNYEVDSYTVDEATGIWTINVTVTGINADDSETKESAVYCGQDGILWKKEL